MRAAYIAAIFLLSLGSCKNRATEKEAAFANFEAILKSNKDTALIDREQKLLKKLGGNELPCLNTIIPPLGNEGTNIVMVITGADCPDCVVAGYDILRQIKDARGTIKTYAVGLTPEVIIKDYHDPVYEDEQKELHASLNYAPTPIILVLEGNRIIDLHIPDQAGSKHSKNFTDEYMY